MLSETTGKPVKAPNYTEAQEKRMREVYCASETTESVELLMKELNKPKRSIVAKLSNLGVYKPPVKTTKTGARIVKKDDLVKEISAQLDGIELSSLAKANKQDLERLSKSLSDHFGVLELEGFE